MNQIKTRDIEDVPEDDFRKYEVQTTNESK